MSPEPDQPLPKRERTRRAILDAAGEVFSVHGIYNAKVEAIAQAAGVSVGTIYGYFPSKAGIALAFVAEGLDAVAADLQRNRDTIASPVARIYAAGDAYFRFATNYPVAARFAAIRVLQPDRSPEYEELNRFFSERVHGMILRVAEDVRDAQLAQEMPVTKIDETMIFLWGLWNGTAALMLRQDELAITADAGHRALEFGRRVLQRAAAHQREHPEPPAGPAYPGS